MVEENVNQQNPNNGNDNDIGIENMISENKEVYVYRYENIGRLKRILDTYCPECGESKLQLRVMKENCIIDGEEVEKDREFKYCPNCEYRQEDKSKKKQHKTRLDEEEVFDNGKNNKKSKRSSSRNGKYYRGSYR